MANAAVPLEGGKIQKKQELPVGLGAVAAAVGGVLPAVYQAQTRTKKTGGGGASQPVTYVDAGGQRRTGVAQAQEDPYWAAMRDYYQQAYNAQVEANEKAAEGAAARARESAETQRQQLNAGYRGTNRQLYRDYMERQRVLPQEMAARGYTGGLSESARVRLANAYGENLAENERARIAREAELNEALAQREYEARSAADRANSQALLSRYTNLAGLRSQQHDTERSDAAARAARLAAAGDFSGYRALGMTEDDADYLGRMWRAANPELAPYQSTGTYVSPTVTSSADSVARYVQATQGTARAIEYIAEELAAGNIFSDEAERIWKQLRQNG